MAIATIESSLAKPDWQAFIEDDTILQLFIEGPFSLSSAYRQ